MWEEWALTLTLVGTLAVYGAVYVVTKPYRSRIASLAEAEKAASHAQRAGLSHFALTHPDLARYHPGPTSPIRWRGRYWLREVWHGFVCAVVRP